MIGNDHGVARTPKRRTPQPSREYRSTARTAREAERAMVALGERVRELRAAAGISQEDAAERAEIGARHWQLVEAGRTNPTLATLVAVARALGVTVGALFDDD